MAPQPAIRTPPDATSGGASALRQRLLAGIKWSTAAAVITQGGGVAVSYLLAHTLGHDGMGEYGIIQSTLASAGVLAGMALGTTATKYIAEYRVTNPERAGRYIGLPLVVALLFSTVGSLIILLLAKVLANQVLAAPVLAGALRAASPLLLLNALVAVQIASLVGLEAYRDVAKATVIFSAGRLLLVPTGALIAGLTGAIVGTIVAQLLFAAVLRHHLKLRCAREHIRISYGGLRQEKSRMLGFSLPAFLSSTVIGPANWLCNVLLVNQPGGYAQMGLINVTTQWQSAIRFIPLRILDVGLPVLSRLHGQGREQEFRSVFKTNIKFVLMITLAVSLPAVALSPVIMRGYGSGFANAYPVLILMVISAVFQMAARVQTQLFLARGKAVLDLVFAILRAVVLLSAWWFLLPHGAVGLAVAICGSYLVMIAVISVYTYSYDRIDQKDSSL